MKRETRLIHSGQPRRSDDLVNPPIERASTVLSPSTAELYNPTPPRRHYGRGGLSPNSELCDAIAGLYKADHVALTSSGLSGVILALRTALPDRPAGFQALITDSVYGPVRRFCDEELPRYGVAPVYYDPRISARDLAQLLQRPTAVVLLESPGSLTFEVQDLPGLTRAAREGGAATVIDDTWSAAILMNPLDLGIDYAAQALTKYAGGHSDFLMGSVAARGAAAARVRDKNVLFGGHVSPDDAFLCLRGLRTLPLRIEQSGRTGLELASRLDNHPRVARVLHPGLRSSPDHALFSQLFSGSAGCFGFILAGVEVEGGEAVAEKLNLFRLGFSWGGYESLVLPCDRQIRRTTAPWVSEGALLRLSAGLEHVDDLWADLSQALDVLDV